MYSGFDTEYGTYDVYLFFIQLEDLKEGKEERKM